jgi:hypothetical protein
MRGLAALLLLATAFTAGLVQPVSAQRLTTDMNRPMLRDLTIRNPKDLVEVCNVLVFRRYAAPGPRWAGTGFEMDPDLHLLEHNRCIQAKGEGYGNPKETHGLQRVVLRTETPVPAPEVKPLPIPEVKPAKPVTPVELTPGQDDKQQQSRRAEAIPRDANRLAELCNAAVFRKYGRLNTLYGPRTVLMDQELHARMQNSCILSKGRSY